MPSKKSRKIKEIKKYLQAFGGFIIIFLLLFLIVKFLFIKNKEKEKINDVVVENNIPIFSNILDGLPVENKEDITPKVIGIMIDNHPKARPQTGLSKASVVYEAPVEGGITRYLAIFNKNQNIEKIGPVRSARPYFIDWIKEYGDTLYMHCGGSPDALNIISKEDIFDANEISKSWFFWRDKKRYAPHNLYTSSEKWNKYFEDYSSKQKDLVWKGWNFSSSTINLLNNKNSIEVKNIKIKYGYNYVVEWKYNQENNNYERYINNILQKDGGEIITAKNILIQSVNTKVLDSEGRKKIDTLGRGEARVINSGKLLNGFWRRNNVERTKFYTENEEEISLIAGKIWVQVIPKNAIVEVAN